MSGNTMPPVTVTIGISTGIGDRAHQCDATATATAPDGTVAVALIDGIGDTPEVADTAGLLARVAARVGCRRGALAGLLAAAELVSSGTADLTVPNAIGVLAVVYPDGQTVVGHCGDARAHSWNGHTLDIHTVDHTLAQLVREHSERGAWRRVGLGGLEDGVRTTLARATVGSIATTTLTAGDHTVILTSDGVHRALGDDAEEHVAAIAQLHPLPRELADRLTRAALNTSTPRGTRDNATAAVLRIH
ncbi:hypothetical protein [Actinosynnema sp. NPDC023587]|uniref:hypothetical protein n=1 Tax=Actinosynnema sp. NPDC023587 TaxID=3154695 RepID=UPI0033C3B387